MSKKILFCLSFVNMIFFSSDSYGKSNHEICSNSDGRLKIEDGKVAFSDGRDSGQTAYRIESQNTVYTVSEKHEVCVDGPNFLSTVITVEEVKIKSATTEEESFFVLCTLTSTGIVPPNVVCD